MKKSLKLATALSVVSLHAVASTNMENPLFLPKKGEVFSKTSIGAMVRKADNTKALQLLGRANKNEFPIYRFGEDIGFGITDKLAIHGSFGYTNNIDTDRKGLHLGRIGLTYRLLEEMNDGLTLDIYSDAHLGGLGKMRGKFTNNTFKYANYSNGRWGFHVGTRVGKTWDKFTLSAFAEVLPTFGNSNNEVDISELSLPGLSKVSVKLKSTTELNTGINTFYEIDKDWSLNAKFTYKHHASNGVEGIDTEIPNAFKPLVNGLLNKFKDMKDGFDEYVISLQTSYNISDNVQTTVYGEYTFDTAKENSQNGSDLKAESGIRLNVKF